MAEKVLISNNKSKKNNEKIHIKRNEVSQFSI